MLLALAFLPVGAIPEAFQDMLEVFPQEAIKLADYFEDAYAGRPRRNGIFSAQFPPKLWSVYKLALDGMPRTNNSVEAWHYGLQVIAHNFYATNVIAQTPLTILISYFLCSYARFSEQRLHQTCGCSSTV
ncbi:hypothetical protein HPB48_026255 [Haemaphysalis longicornis]|uniref:Uncharacterized protein n=1 Tax=Haemaphysalis longicornis TaxID=44386 RepID=A0A9J6H946_HAELO|nr:hypothetical protein HPB48_026255 [Haemaphysalis longicornis]